MSRINPEIFARKLNNLRERREELAEQLARVDVELSAFNAVLDACSGEVQASDDSSSIAPSLRDVSLEDALIAVAEENEGFFDGYYNKQPLVDAGLLVGEPSAVSQKLYETLSKSERFEKADKRGKWKLLPPPKSLGLAGAPISSETTRVGEWRGEGLPPLPTQGLKSKPLSPLATLLQIQK